MLAFGARACGCPKDWNEQANVMHWGQDTMKRYSPQPERKAQADVKRFPMFLEKKVLKDGRPLWELWEFVGEPED